jgi:signal transduction histidine kinase
MQKEGVKIEEFISAAIKNVSKKAKTKNILIEKSVNGFSVVGNKESLTQLITILLDNAVKYSEKETKICLSAEKQNKVAIITVVDEGVGIAEKDLPYIFDRFYRADSSRSKTGADGYGLGLSIAKKIVDANGGKIFVESEINTGSTFRLELPLVES